MPDESTPRAKAPVVQPCRPHDAVNAYLKDTRVMVEKLLPGLMPIVDAMIHKVEWIYQDALISGMFNVASALSDELHPGPALVYPDDIVQVALRQPVSLAAAFDDLCNDLDLLSPRFVNMALSGYPGPVHYGEHD